jgi:hypothetical protein
MRARQNETVTVVVEMTIGEAQALRWALHGSVPETCDAPEGPLQDLCEALYASGVLVL